MKRFADILRKWLDDLSEPKRILASVIVVLFIPIWFPIMIVGLLLGILVSIGYNILYPIKNHGGSNE